MSEVSQRSRLPQWFKLPLTNSTVPSWCLSHTTTYGTQEYVQFMVHYIFFFNFHAWCESSIFECAPLCGHGISQCVHASPFKDQNFAVIFFFILLCYHWLLVFFLVSHQLRLLLPIKTFFQDLLLFLPWSSLWNFLFLQLNLIPSSWIMKTHKKALLLPSISLPLVPLLLHSLHLIDYLIYKIEV